MLPKKNRADKKVIDTIFGSIKPVLHKVGFISSKNITLKFVLNYDQKPFRVSFVVPKSIAKSAVKRNLLKRRGYKAFSNTSLPLPLGFCGVFVFGKKSLDVFGGKINKSNNPIHNLELEIKDILNKIRH